MDTGGADHSGGELRSTTPPLGSERLALEPLSVEHAREMVAVLADPELYEFTGGQPPTLADLERRYQAQIGGPPDADEQWHNWILRELGTGVAVGFVQASVREPAAEIAWVIGTDHQGRGYAKEAATAMAAWLETTPIRVLRAFVHSNHAASAAVATHLGLTDSGQLHEGEQDWERWLEI